VGVILFEMLVGFPPFNEDSVDKIFDNIRGNNVCWDEIEIGDEEDQMGENAADLIKSLMEQDPRKRLGYNGVNEIKDHPFFKGLDWENIRNKKAPFIPDPPIIEVNN